MKKAILSLAFVAIMFVSCKENTPETTETVDSTIVETPIIEEAPVTDSTVVPVDSAVAKSQETAKVKFQRAN